MFYVHLYVILMYYYAFPLFQSSTCYYLVSLDCNWVFLLLLRSSTIKCYLYNDLYLTFSLFWVANWKYFSIFSIFIVKMYILGILVQVCWIAGIYIIIIGKIIIFLMCFFSLLHRKYLDKNFPCKLIDVFIYLFVTKN